MMEAMSISRSDIAPATKGSEQGTGNDSRRRVWRIAIRRLRLVAVRNIACACVRMQGYGGGMVGAASARTGSGSLFFLALSFPRDIAPATKGSEQGTGNDSQRRVWRIAIRRLRLVTVRIRLVAVRNIACACVRVQGYGGGMVGAASARTGSGSCWRSRRLVTFTAPATFRFLGGITCDHEPIAEVGMGHAGALSQVARAATRAGGSVTRWRGMSRGSPGKGGARR